MKERYKEHGILLEPVQPERVNTQILKRASILDFARRKQVKAAWRFSGEKFAQAFRCSPDPITITTLEEGYYVEVNGAWVEITGYEPYQAIGRTGVDLGIWCDIEDRRNMLEAIRSQGRIKNYETNYCVKSGEKRTFLVSAEIIELGRKHHLLCVHKDISERQIIQEALRVSEERFAKAFTISPATMSITLLEDGRYLAVNDSYCQILGYDREEILGRTTLEMKFWLDPGDRAKMLRMVHEKGQVRDLPFHFRKGSGEERLGLYSSEVINVDGELCLLSIVTDITDHSKAEEEVKYLNFHDRLTGLFNRAFAEAHMKIIDTNTQLPISVIMGDINGLKLINDAFGHQEGDGLLVAVAEIFKQACRPGDVAARWGGDEFMILLPKCETEAASTIFDRLKRATENIPHLNFRTSISLGLASNSSLTRDIRDVIREAEDKMYRNKLLEDRSNRSSFLFSLQKALWTRSHETEEHCQRIKRVAQIIGQSIKLPDSELDNLKLLSFLHDIGKIAIPNSILEKSGKLSPEEWETIRKHPEIGYRIALSSPEMAPVAEAILHHHERWDGSGYPLGLKGEEIPLISRIIAIADTYDVMINGRLYQKAVSKEAVWKEIERCAGSQFDPELVKRALEVLGEL